MAGQIQRSRCTCDHRDKVANGKSVKDGVGGTYIGDHMLCPLDQYSQPQAGGILAPNKQTLLN